MVCERDNLRLRLDDCLCQLQADHDQLAASLTLHDAAFVHLQAQHAQLTSNLSTVRAKNDQLHANSQPTAEQQRALLVYSAAVANFHQDCRVSQISWGVPQRS